MTLDQSLLGKLARSIGDAPTYAARGGGAQASILAIASQVYGRRTEDEDLTQPTGFDPAIAAMFEAVIESAFIVANADHEFDDAERQAFKQVVVTACANRVSEAQVLALLADLEELLREDGIDKRVQMVGRSITKPEYAREVLRVAALMAHVSSGVSTAERNVLDKLRVQFGLEADALNVALQEVQSILAE
jgi:tellurite resistance protein